MLLIVYGISNMIMLWVKKSSHWAESLAEVGKKFFVRSNGKSFAALMMDEICGESGNKGEMEL